ncbi:hypothetical protein CRUP_031614 [Coryphaenoides rupestris]|nr:hypothetical protein CRUP_031614 [Coryphaenoides rupestris]
MVGLRPSDVPPPLAVKMMSAGMAACIADLITFPLDTAKVRLQGPRSLYNGLIAGLQRQVCFASIRIGLYDNGPRSLYNGLIAGLQRQVCFASIRIGLYDNPTDVVKVRFQAQMNLDGVARRYNGTMQAYKHIFMNEGLRGLWKGTLPNITRNALVNCTELVTYDLIKESILKHNLLSDNLPCHFVSAFGAGFVTTVVAFVPSFLRLGSWNVVMFVSFEQIKRAMMAAKTKMDAPNTHTHTLVELLLCYY